MSHIGPANMTTKELVDLFAEIGIAQSQALLRGENAKFSQLYWRMDDVSNELKRRDGDQRRNLIALYNHPNVHVRLNAAKRTLAVAPVEARNQLQAIVDSRRFPQAGDAGMCLDNLESGFFKPK